MDYLEGTYVPVKSKLQHLPGQSPGQLNFWKIFVQIPGTGPKSCSNSPIPGENYQITVLTFQWFIRQHMFVYYRYKSFLNTFKYGTQLVYTFRFQPIRHEYAIFTQAVLDTTRRACREKFSHGLIFI